MNEALYDKVYDVDKLHRGLTRPFNTNLSNDNIISDC